MFIIGLHSRVTQCIASQGSMTMPTRPDASCVEVKDNLVFCDALQSTSGANWVRATAITMHNFDRETVMEYMGPNMPASLPYLHSDMFSFHEDDIDSTEVEHYPAVSARERSRTNTLQYQSFIRSNIHAAIHVTPVKRRCMPTLSLNLQELGFLSRGDMHHG